MGSKCFSLAKSFAIYNDGILSNFVYVGKWYHTTFNENLHVT